MQKAVVELNACGHSLGAFRNLRGRRRPHVHQFWKSIQTQAAKLSTYLKAYVDIEDQLKIDSESR